MVGGTAPECTAALCHPRNSMFCTGLHLAQNGHHWSHGDLHDQCNQHPQVLHKHILKTTEITAVRRCKLWLVECSSLWPLGSCNNNRSDRINCLGFSDHRSAFINFELQIRSNCRHRSGHIKFWDRSDCQSGSINFLPINGQIADLTVSPSL